MQFPAEGFTEQSGNAGTDQHGDPFAEEQFRIAEVLRS